MGSHSDGGAVMSARKRTAVGLLGLWALLTLGGFGLTGASFTDIGNVNVGGAGGRIGSTDAFDLALVDQQGRVLQADGPSGAQWAVPGADTLLPGHSVTTNVRVFNNSRRLPADLEVSIVPRNGDGRVSASVPNITPHLRFTATLSDGTVLFEDATLADAGAVLPTLAAGARASQQETSTYVTGATGSSSRITLTIDYLDEPGVELLNGGQAAIGIRFDATSRSGL